MGLIVFTDLDGTLLDHGDYSYEAARPALEALRQRYVPLVLATSKTAAEVAALHRELGLGDTPAIVENGAGIFRPGADQEAQGEAYERIRRALAEIAPELRADFRGFGDMTPEEIAQITGLPLEGAVKAAQRCHSEPGLWNGSDAARAAFLSGLSMAGVVARSGGRFLTLTLGRTKADAMRDVAQELDAERVFALGDAPNDIEMLEAADRGVIVRNDHGTGLPPLAGETEGRIFRTEAPGPEGWNAAVLALLDAFDRKDLTHG